MKKNITKALFLLTRNARITTKELARKMHVSQQVASYTVSQLEKKKEIFSYTSTIDTVKLGLMHVIVGINITDFKEKKEILKYLVEAPGIVEVKEGRQGVDLIIEYSISNLSHFYKLHSIFMRLFNKAVRKKFIYPVIVRHLFPKNYLSRSKYYEDIVILGDRPVEVLSDHEMTVLHAFALDPTATFTSIAKKTNLSAKTIVSIKQRLEKRNIIREYTATLNVQKLDFKQTSTFIRLGNASIGELSKLIEFCKVNQFIVKSDKLIGYYDILVTIESTKRTNVLKEIREQFSVEDYLIVPTATTLLKKSLPNDI